MRAEQGLVAAALDTRDRAAKEHFAAAAPHVSGEGLRDQDVVDDPRLRYVDRPDAGDVGLDLPSSRPARVLEAR